MTMRMLSIGDIADILPGYAFKSSLYSSDGVKLLRGVNVSPESIDWSDCAFWRKTDDDGLDNYILQNGDIVIGMDRPWISSGFRIARVGNNDLPSLLVQRVARLRTRQGHNQRYLYYILCGSGFQSHLKNLHTETTVPHISHKDIESFKVEIPALSEQRRIADILDKADAIRRKRKQAIALTDQLLRSTFLEMFGDPVTNPKGFPNATLAEVVTFRSGEFLPAREMNKDGIYPVYGGNGITGFHGKYMFQEPMVVVGRVGVYCGATHLTRENSWITDNALYVASMSPSLIKTYLYHALVNAKLNQYASQSAQPLISGSRLGRVPVLIPPVPLQQRFAEIALSHERLSQRQRQLEEHAAQLFGALVDRAFRGELSRTEQVAGQLSMFNK